MTISIRKVTNEDWEQVKFIYEAGIATRIATFETQAPSTFEHWISNANLECSLVVHEESTILGWCKLTPVSLRKVYSGVGEISIYIHPNAKGKGIGNLLLQTLINKSEEQGFWTLEAKIFLENEASIHLHKKNGFKVVGIREKIGKRDGVWRDNIFLERRSKVVGVS
ncbi:phosphinothricin acetyltransferase [Ureibacillus massiliensis 4400831 = CIP 108448 = CCUG 49529]|uniref:Phosphinothricin acetyltransferase n=1 Tax=Ureibacillus massiliensis 4400831 = CIP 108448 = CCUG 49529 TaxID=1211035 RepID=A0A0A3IYF0_9BACL|nr:GNAT family N-acetyltransferase [Ureibacillus massiliensis]KGR89774.1 phosphinothricin acetyltransferase [Ureibacillus massiliensis 4400831 = CIP 108448 = CCUG 49529]BDH63580.1 N-acetyltransferase [Lysinibacillus sp. PLM2]